MAADQRFVVPERHRERRDGRRISLVAEGDADVAEQATALRTFNRAALETASKRLVVKIQESDEIEVFRAVPRRVRLRRYSRNKCRR